MTGTASTIIDLSSGPLIEVVERGIDRLFHEGASDITLQSDDYIWAYINRRHTRVSSRRLDDSELGQLTTRFYPGGESGMAILGGGTPLDPETSIRPRLDPQKEDYDPDYELRCRANITKCRVGTSANGISITLRTIPGTPPALASLGLPEEIVQTMFPSQGLVLVAGITGSGKSTLLAAANAHRLAGDEPVKILTYEDPVEFIYPRLPASAMGPGGPSARMPEVSQVQLHSHLESFSLVAPNLLRRKADVIVMGEMRDRESMETGLLASATGHCTYATLHCETPAEVIARVVSEFPYERQPAVANQLLDNLRLVIAQKIERDVSGKGRAFRSWCVFDQALKHALSELPFQQWARRIRQRILGRKQDFAHQALSALRAGEISPEAFARVAGFNPIEAREFLQHAESEEAACGS
ncbi:type IV pilus twitching motility protein PilT [Ramlibacter sp. AN1133]|uniref:type IV pilus twitching motility protein PilT n=1 Tax=Ramlibacter sp. AN1133 TaxID=3133429 RepID=UPI0030C602DF